MRRLRPFGALVLATAAWGVATSAGKYAVGGLGAFTTLFIEVSTGALVLWAVMWRVRPRWTVAVGQYAFLGLLEPLIAYGALDLGLQHTGAADAALLDGLQSMMVLILGVIFVNAAVGARSVAGVLIATAGGALPAGAHLTPGAGLGDGLVLFAGLAASASVLVVSGLAADASALELTAYQDPDLLYLTDDPEEAVQIIIAAHRAVL
ncbi:MAG TPA: DMT family transporter [Streptosporangiaceae bacterium]|nr:DMT family transporter [Streptosporangiaceae bacterium]